MRQTPPTRLAHQEPCRASASEKVGIYGHSADVNSRQSCQFYEHVTMLCSPAGCRRRVSAAHHFVNADAAGLSAVTFKFSWWLTERLLLSAARFTLLAAYRSQQ
jgi:hypothetical protein